MTTTEQTSSPLRENWVAILFMVVLLVVAGGTATTVGYKVKSADRQRKQELLEAYKSLGGSYEKSLLLGQTVLAPSMNEEQKVFVSTYELNERARKIGLYQVIETSSPESLDTAQEGLMEIGASEGGLSLRDALVSFREAPTPPKTLNPLAARFARQYDRNLARDAEVKLYKYLTDHRMQIQPK